MRKIYKCFDLVVVSKECVFNSRTDQLRTHKDRGFGKKKGLVTTGLVEGLKSLINSPALPEIWAITNERIFAV